MLGVRLSPKKIPTPTNTPPRSGCAQTMWRTFRLFQTFLHCGRNEHAACSTCLSQSSSRNVVLWDFCDTWRIFLPDHIAGRFSCSNVTNRTRRGGVRMGVESILLIVILAFAAGFLLAIR